MNKTRNPSPTRLSRAALCGLLLIASLAWCQQPAEGERPLGDVARQQREQRQHAKPARRVLSDDDLGPGKLRRIWSCSSKTYPCMQISGMVPADAPASIAPSPTNGTKTKYIADFGPHDYYNYGCGGDYKECAERSFLSSRSVTSLTNAPVRLLYDWDGVVAGYPARMAQFEVDRLPETMVGTVTLVVVPEQVLAAYCMYPKSLWETGEDVCNTFMSTLQVEVPGTYKRTNW
jgi:hypothetical protein